MRDRRTIASWPVVAACLVLLVPTGCRRGAAPAADNATAPAIAIATPTADELARREREVAEREARVAERETALAERDRAPAPRVDVPSRAEPPRATRPAPTAAPAAEPPAAPAPAAQVESPEAPAPAPRAAVEAVLPAGTALDVEFPSPIASNTVAAGSTFGARLAADVVVGGLVALPAGTEVHGAVVEAVPAKKIGGQARLALRFDHLRLATGESIPIAAAFAAETASQTGKDAATIGGAAAGGAVLGNVLDKKHRSRGTVLGAVVGGAIGTAIAARSPGEEVVIAAGSVLEVRLSAAVAVPVRD